MSIKADEIKEIVDVGKIDVAQLLAALDAMQSRWSKESNISSRAVESSPTMKAGGISERRTKRKCSGELVLLLAETVHGKMIKNPQPCP